jgi:hypothetical protein
MEEPISQENETPNQKQARLRRERRQAKIAAGGSDRLNKITGVQGRQVSESEGPLIVVFSHPLSDANP